MSNKAIEEAFASTTRLLFQAPLGPFSKYSIWAGLRVPGGRMAKSSLGVGEVYLPDYGFFKKIPQGRAASLEDMEKAAAMKIQEADAAGTFEEVVARLGSVAYFVPTYEEGRNMGLERTAAPLDCLNVSDAFDPFTTKNSAKLFSVMDCEAVFGMYRVLKTSFSIHCYNSEALSRCFEMDFGKNCSDSLFCHNVENMAHCMFCFNAKNKRYAIGNLEVGQEKYMQIKKELVSKIVAELEKTGSLSYDIYSILGGRKH